MIAAGGLTLRIGDAILCDMSGNHNSKPSVLIADDDPVSLHFLAAALRQFGCEVTEAVNGRSACAAARVHRFDLMLLDRRMPDLGGTALLAAMRLLGVGTPAVATSAEVDADTALGLSSAGFVAVVAKPVMLQQLRRTLDPHLHLAIEPASANSAPAALLDDVTAMAAVGGDRTAVHALRTLLVEEIAMLCAQLAGFKPADDPNLLREHLHRLRASCGFCGATGLAEAAVKLDTALRDQVNVQTALGEFLQLCRTTHTFLRSQSAAAAVEARTSPSMPQARNAVPSR
jgi:CheY-like chemotaxis protein